MSLETKFPKEVKQILSKYPPEHKRSAVMPLLYLAQREEGHLTKAAMQDVAKIVGITETDVAALVGFYRCIMIKRGQVDAGLH
jgi:NADH:ubiquinone oxidoreductase subunit E